MHADGWREVLIPLSAVVVLQRLVGEHTGRTDLDEGSAEFVLQNAILVTAEEHRVTRGERVEIRAARVVAIVTDAAVALDAAVHLMIHERTQVLIDERSL